MTGAAQTSSELLTAAASLSTKKRKLVLDFEITNLKDEFAAKEAELQRLCEVSK